MDRPAFRRCEILHRRRPFLLGWLALPRAKVCRHLRFLLLAAAAAAAAWPGPAAAGGSAAGLRPVGRQRLEPWKASLSFELAAPRHPQAAPPPGKPWPAAALERAQREARVAPGLPPGRELPEIEVDPDGPDDEFRALAPEREVAFAGLDDDDAGFAGSRFFPPDTHVAAGPTQVLEVANVAVRRTDPSGGGGETESLNVLFAESRFVFDPKVLYDDRTNRFFIVALMFSDDPRRSFIYLAVSRSADLQGLSAPEDFCTYRIRAKRGGSFADYPGIGVNERRLAISVNNFAFAGGFRSAWLYTLDVDRLADNAVECPGVTVERFKLAEDPEGIPAFTVQPALHGTASGLPGQPLFLVSGQPLLLGSDRYVLWRLATDGDGELQVSREMVQGGALYTLPPLAEQGDGSLLDTGDTRVMQAAFRDGELWFVHATGCAVGALPNESCVRAVALRPAAVGVAVDLEETYGRSDRFYFWPGVAIAGSGDVVAAFQSAGPAGKLGVSYNGKPRGAGGFDAIRRLRRGRCVLDDFDPGLGAHRTGDYVGVAPDPTDDRDVWVAGEFAGEGPDGCRWETRIGRVRYD